MDNDDENGTASGAQPPVRHVTLNQVVAWNTAFWRRRAGLRQHELGDRIGWTNTAVSEAERSWDGKRTREFDAQTTAAIAVAIGVPLNAMYLPPEDDGIAARYVFTLDGGVPQGMAALMAAIMPDNDDESAVMETYRDRVLRSAEKYLAPPWAEDVARWLGAADAAELNLDRALRLRHRLALLEDVLDEFGELAARIEEQAREAGQ